MPDDTQPEVIPSNRELARLLGRNEAAIRQWRAHPDWNFGPSPWAVTMLPAFEQWRDSRPGKSGEAEGEGDPAASARTVDIALKVARLEHTEASTVRVRLATEILARRFVPVADVAADLADFTSTINAAAGRLPRAVCASLSWLEDEQQRADVAAACAREVQQQLAGPLAQELDRIANRWKTAALEAVSENA
jgi:hypothetical protein